LIVGGTQTVTSPAAPEPTAAARVPTAADCRRPDAFASLAALPATRLMAPIDLGAHLLLFTPHAVVAAPYHRDQAGVRDTFRFLNEPIEESRQILAARGVSLVVICSAMPELHGMPGTAADSFVKLLPDNRLPAWLTETTAPGSVLRVFSVAS